MKRTTALSRPLATGLLLALGTTAAAVVTTPAFAQDYTSGAIQGTVTGTDGKAVAGATVTVHSLDQGFTQTTTTSADGGFRFVGLPPGRYDVTTSEAGFKSQTQTGVLVEANHSASYAIVLKGEAAAGVETVTVSGTRQVFDFTNTTTGMTMDVADLNKTQPIGHDLQDIIQLAPGANADQKGLVWGNLTSISGASVAENAYYINGLNVTNFNDYLGSASVPFYFIKSTEVLTGGYSPEYGRATGGITNLVTKSGSNDVMAAVHLDWEPDALRSTSPNTYAYYNKGYKENDFATTIEASGPIIKDHLFIYGLMQLKDDTYTSDGILTQQSLTDTDTSPFYGTKIDGYITDTQHLEFTWFQTNDKRYETAASFDPTTDMVGSGSGSAPTTYRAGGVDWVAKYTGNFFSWLTLSAAYGIDYQHYETLPGSGDAYVEDDTGQYCGSLGSLCTSQTNTGLDQPYDAKRKFWRVDGDVYFNFFGDHHVRGGVDNEYDVLARTTVGTGPSADNSQGGGIAYYFDSCATGNPTDPWAHECETAAGVPLAGITPTTNYVELDYYNVGGKFKTVNDAYYLEDEWKVLDTGLTLNLGVRLDQMHNYTGNGTRYVNFDHLYAPRIGFNYTPWFDDNGQFYGSFGDYYLPIAANTAYREASTAYYFQEYWTTTGMANGMPILGTQLTGWNGANKCPLPLTANSGPAGTIGCSVTSNGTTPDPTSDLQRNIAATEEQEIKFGYKEHLDIDPDKFYGGEWTLGVDYTNRELLETADDTDMDPAINNWCTAHGIAGCSSFWSGFHQYTIINPGSNPLVVLGAPLPGANPTTECTSNGGKIVDSLCEVQFTAAELGLTGTTNGFSGPAKRNYDSLEFTFSRAFDGVWGMDGSFTWARLKGNTEGYVISDRATGGQTDAGITEDWDLPEFEQYAYGWLPTAREYTFKVGGSWQATDDLLLGARLTVASPFHESCYGYNASYSSGTPTTPDLAYYYGPVNYYCLKNGVLVPSPRGTAQQTDWEYDLDMSARYSIEVPSGQKLTFRADVFNILNLSAVDAKITESQEGSGAPDPHYGLPSEYQTPRYVRLGLDIDF